MDKTPPPPPGGGGGGRPYMSKHQWRDDLAGQAPEVVIVPTHTHCFVIYSVHSRR